MPSVMTLSDIYTQALDRADMIEDEVPDVERLYDYVNVSIGELYDMLVGAYESYFYDTDEITLVSGTESYSLPSDFYKSVRVFYLVGSQRYEMRRFNIDELAETPIYADNRYLKYRIMGDKIWFSPSPSAAGTVELWYIPEVTKFAVDGSEDNTPLTFHAPVQWEEYLILSTAIRLVDREESDSSALRASKQEQEKRILSMATDRDAGEPGRIADIRKRRSRRPGVRGW